MNEPGISVEKISLARLAQYREFIAKARPKSYSCFSELPEQALTDLFFQEIEEIKDSSTSVFMARSGNRPVAMLIMHKLDWDTNHFGMPMARIKRILGGVDPESDLPAKKMLIAEAAAEMKRSGFRHAAIRLPTDEIVSIYALERMGFYLADTVVEYYFDHRRSKIRDTAPQCDLRLFQPSDLPVVEKSTSGIFKDYFGRFHNDPNLDKIKADQLYEKWLINSCKGLADDCVLAFIGGELAGITTLKILNEINEHLPFKIGEVGISGTVPGFRGKKVYSSMIGFAQKHFADKVDLFKYTTQSNNFNTQKGLAKMGFCLRYAYYTFHFYMPGG